MRRAWWLAPLITSVVLLTLPSPAYANTRVRVAAQPRRSAVTTWAARYDGANLEDVAYAIKTSPDGTRVFVTGEGALPDHSRDYTTIAYDAATGTQLWLTRYDGNGCDYDEAYAMAVSPDGSALFVTGSSCGAYATVAYDAATGTQLWVARVEESIASAITVSPDGRKVYVTGYDVARWHTVAYDAATGRLIWLSQYVGHGLEANIAESIGVSQDGRSLFVTGWNYTGNSDDYATVAYNATTGSELWVAEYNDPSNGYDEAYSVGVAPDGSRVYVTGQSGAGGYDDYATVAYDARSGDQLWVATYDGPSGRIDEARSLGVSPDGTRIYVTGQSNGQGSSADYATIAYDSASGTQLWVARYDGPESGMDDAFALGVDPGGSLVYVTGRSTGIATHFDYATVAYDATTGDQVWESRYDGPANRDDFALALAVGSNGSVFITGESKGHGKHFDYATVGMFP